MELLLLLGFIGAVVLLGEVGERVGKDIDYIVKESIKEKMEIQRRLYELERKKYYD